MNEGMDFSIIDKIVKQTTEAIESSKESLFEIAETAKNIHRNMESELEQLNQEVQQVIEKVDHLEEVYHQARVRLMEVSHNFSHYAETDIKNAYLYARELQVQLAVERERENGLRLRREELTRSITDITVMSRKADELVSKVDLALTLLSGNLAEVSQQMEGMHQKQQVAGKIILAQEEERKRVAREIHDGPAQTMANVVMRAEFCEKLLMTNRSEVGEELRELKQVVRGSLQEIRRIIFNLRPMTLDDLGLIPTVKRYIEVFKETGDFEVELFIDGEERRLKNTYEAALFRLIQEGLTNARKHAHASYIKVSIGVTAENFKVRVADDGVGFDLDAVLSKASGRESFGLLSMKERIELLDGRLTIDSAVGAGTRITALIPLDPAIYR